VGLGRVEHLLEREVRSTPARSAALALGWVEREALLLEWVEREELPLEQEASVAWRHQVLELHPARSPEPLET